MKFFQGIKGAFLHFIYYLSNTDPKMLKYFSLKARIIQHIIGLSVFLAALVSTMSFIFFLATVFEGHSAAPFIIIIGGVIWFMMIATLDKSIFLARSKWSIIVRMLVVALIATFTSTPFKLMFVDKKIKAEIINNHKKEQAKAYEGVSNLEADHRVKTNQIDQKIREAEAEKTEMERLRNAEDSGIKLRGTNSGVSGRGQRWNHYNNQVLILDKQIAALKREKNGLENGFVKDKTLAENRYNKSVPTNDDSFVSRYIAFKKLMKSADPETSKTLKETNVGLYLLFMIVELFPALLKLVLGKSNAYLQEMDAMDELEKEMHQRKRSYIKAKLDVVAPEEIKNQQVTADDLQEGMDEINEMLKYTKEPYKKGEHTGLEYTKTRKMGS